MMVAAEVDPERLVFVDEMGLHTSLAPLYGYSRKGENACTCRFHVIAPVTPRFRPRSPLAGWARRWPSRALYLDPGSLRGEAYVEHALAPTLLEAGQVVIMDDLCAHKPVRVRELIEGKGCELVYLPAYSPDFDPIEEAFSKIKGMLRQAGARTRDALVGAFWAKRFRRSASRTRELTSSMPAIVYKSNYCETRCRHRR